MKRESAQMQESFQVETKKCRKGTQLNGLDIKKK